MKLSSPVAIFKICIIVLGAIIFILGLYSHFASIWTAYDAFKPCASDDPRKCDHVIYEKYCVSIVTICFFASTISLTAEIFANKKSKLFKLADLIFHGVAAVLIILAGILYLISALQFRNLTNTIRQRRDEKIAAGSLSLFQGILYVCAAFFIYRENPAD